MANIHSEVSRHEDVLGSGGIPPRIRWPPALDGGEWSASRPGRFNPTEREPATHRIGGWVGPRAGLNTRWREKLPERNTNTDLSNY
jgi:hypothetical protein